MLTGDFRCLLMDALNSLGRVDRFEMSTMESAAETSLGHYARRLTKEEHDRIQSNQTVSDWQRNRLEIEAKKNWDKFYMRNSIKFFKDRHWTKNEFQELITDSLPSADGQKPVLLELGCGTGNFLWPLIEENTNFYIYATDFSPRAVNFVQSNELYDESKCKAFVADITDEKFDEQFKQISGGQSVDVVSLIFVLSAINPDKMKNVLENCYKALKPSGKVIIRDYGLYDHAQIRFDPKNKISENFYHRVDGTRAFYFSEEFMESLAKSVGFEVHENRYIAKETTNRKEQICVPRVFIQSKLAKPIAATES